MNMATNEREFLPSLGSLDDCLSALMVEEARKLHFGPDNYMHIAKDIIIVYWEDKNFGAIHRAQVIDGMSQDDKLTFPWAEGCARYGETPYKVKLICFAGGMYITL